MGGGGGGGVVYPPWHKIKNFKYCRCKYYIVKDQDHPGPNIIPNLNSVS